MRIVGLLWARLIRNGQSLQYLFGSVLGVLIFRCWSGSLLFAEWCLWIRGLVCDLVVSLAWIDPEATFGCWLGFGGTGGLLFCTNGN